mmetsp:Transcript_3567/g.4487  ORF Transcript_3567/g.4487 Transcript_3567/m.4487 type:complete len:100 (+) Transcript_3567:426-725(+)
MLMKMEKCCASLSIIQNFDVLPIAQPGENYWRVHQTAASLGTSLILQGNPKLLKTKNKISPVIFNFYRVIVDMVLALHIPACSECWFVTLDQVNQQAEP